MTPAPGSIVPTRPVRAWLGGALAAIAVAFLATACLAAGRGGRSPAPTTPAVAAVVLAPSSLLQLDPWLDFRRQARLPALPEEARMFYRRGLLTRETGSRDEASRLVRGAIELDPTFLAARVTLFRWELTRDPSQSLAQASGIVDLVRRDFATQWSLASDAAYALVNAWLLALLAAGLMILLVHNAELRHAVHERVQRWATPASSRTWSWVVIVAPFLLGCGVTLSVLAGLGALWPVLRARERAVWVLLFASLLSLPFVARGFDRVALPMRSESALGAVLPLGAESWTAERADAMTKLAARLPADPFALFGSGWMALRQGDGIAAEAAYRAVLREWPEDDRALDNLGTALIQQGRRDAAVEEYRRAVQSNPSNATAHFNLAEAYLLGFEFDQANRVMARASSLDFDLVSEFKNQPARNGTLDPVPDWISPRRQWEALRATPSSPRPALPPAWRNRIETSPRFAWIAFVVGLASLVLGLMLNRALPLYRCVNCDRVVCRRCAERRRAQAMCAVCARVARGAASADFSRILLTRERDRSTRVLRGVRFAVALVVPGAGMIGGRRVWRALMLLFMTAMVLTAWPGSTWPYAARPRVAITSDPWGLGGLIPLVLIGCLSIWGYLGDRSKTARRAAELLHTTRTRRKPSTRVADDDPQREVA